MQSGQQPATVNLKVDMVAQHGQDPSLQLAVPGISPGASNDEKKEEPESKRGRGSVPPRMGKRAASNSRDSASPRRFIHQPMRSLSASSGRSVWSGSALGPETSDTSLFEISVSPPQVRMNAADWTIIKIVEQMETNADHFRRDMQSMKDAIQIMYVSQQQQMVDFKDIAQQAQVQQDAYIEQSKEMKIFKDQFDNLRVAEDYIVAMHNETESVKAKIDMLQKVAEEHAERENRMSHYLETLDQQRPAEGQTVIQAF